MPIKKLADVLCDAMHWQQIIKPTKRKLRSLFDNHVDNWCVFARFEGGELVAMWMATDLDMEVDGMEPDEYPTHFLQLTTRLVGI